MSDEKKYRLASLMLHTNRMHRLLIDEKVKNSGFKRTSLITLLILSKENKIDSQKLIADKLDITPAAVTGILKKLESDGYITRSLGNDNRFNEIEITELGRKTVEVYKEMFNSTDMSLFEGFSPEELDVYINCLVKLSNNLKRSIEHEKIKSEGKDSL